MNPTTSLAIGYGLAVVLYGGYWVYLPPLKTKAEIDRKLAADDRLDAVARHLVGEFQRPEHVVGVGQRQRRLVVSLGKLGEPGDRKRAFEQ